MSKEPFKFQGKCTAIDGCGAVAWVERLQSSAVAAYPITPSGPMGVNYQRAVANGKTNAWGQTLVFLESESEHSSASVCEGYALTGGRIANFTSGQGLILMKEVLYPIAGKRLPVVFSIGARALSVQALTIHAGHDDVMGVADCGWGMLFARTVQEAADFTLIARKTAEDTFTPFFNIQDGFFTTHTVERVCLPEADLVKAYIKHPDKALANFLDPENPVMSGTAQNQDSYMRSKIAQRAYYKAIKKSLRGNMQEFYQLTGRKYGLIDCHQMADAEYAIVGMGSFMGTAEIAVNAIRKESGLKVGIVSVHSYRPFPGPELVEALKNVNVISILERLDEGSAPCNPLARDIKAAFCDALLKQTGYPEIKTIPLIQAGSGGLGGLDVTVEDIQAIVTNMTLTDKGKTNYCIGVNHADALPRTGSEINVGLKDYFALRGYSVAGFGSISANKVMAAVCLDLFNLHVQAYPKYGAEKRGLPTMYFLALSGEYIKMHQELHRVNLVAINDPTAVYRLNPLEGIETEGIVFLRSPERDPETIWNQLPEMMRETILKKKLRLYALNTAQIAQSVASVPDMIIRLQGIVFLGALLKITPFLERYQISEEQCFDAMKQILGKYFGKGAIEENLNGVKKGFQEVLRVK